MSLRRRPFLHWRWWWLGMRKMLVGSCPLLLRSLPGRWPVTWAWGGDRQASESSLVCYHHPWCHALFIGTYSFATRRSAYSLRLPRRCSRIGPCQKTSLSVGEERDAHDDVGGSFLEGEDSCRGVVCMRFSRGRRRLGIGGTTSIRSLVNVKIEPSPKCLPPNTSKRRNRSKRPC
jgi:hypothetical protein